MNPNSLISSPDLFLPHVHGANGAINIFQIFDFFKSYRHASENLKLTNHKIKEDKMCEDT